VDVVVYSFSYLTYYQTLRSNWQTYCQEAIKQHIFAESAGSFSHLWRSLVQSAIVKTNGTAYSTIEKSLANRSNQIAIVIKQKHMLMAVKVLSEFFGENNLLGFSEGKSILGGVVIAGFYRCVAGDTRPIKTLIRSASPNVGRTLLVGRDFCDGARCPALVRIF
jgi:hypothetical protein